MNLNLILIIALAFGGFFIAYKIYDAGQDNVENQVLKIENKEIKDVAQNFANRPRTSFDRVQRLCAWGQLRSKDEGKPIKRLPVYCSQRSI